MPSEQGLSVKSHPSRSRPPSRQYRGMVDHLQPLALGPWKRMRRLAAAHPRLRDIAIALAVAALSISALAAQHRLGRPAVIVFCLCLCAPLALRRNRLLAFAVIAAVCFLQWLVSVPQLADAAVLVALYRVALDGEPAAVVAAAVVVEAGAIMAALRWSHPAPLKTWVGLTALAVAAAVLGVTIRQRRALVASLHERAARLEFERDQEGRLGAASERARIAREMHDIVSHNLTVMISLADGATYAMDASPERALPAIQRISATGRQALVEMRRLLGVLKEEPDEHPLEPQPSLERLDDLVARVNAAGIPVSMQIDGASRQLADGVQLAVFRVAQEALTNTLRHAGRPTRAQLRLRCDCDQVELEVIDTGGNGGDGVRSEAVTVGGRGLRGMRERAAAYGGELQAGPMSHGGWRVHLKLDAGVAER